MGKSIGLLFAVLATWAMVEVYTEGMDGAFGGRLASMGMVEEGAASGGPVTKRVGAAVERAHAAQESRYDELIPE
jgi:hypothetical protein